MFYIKEELSMDNKNKTKNIVASVISMILGAITICLSYFAGVTLKGEVPEAVSAIFTVLLLIILLINIIYGIVKNKKMQKMKVAEVNEMMLRRKQNIKENFELATHRLHRTSLFCKLYVAFITVFMHINAFLLGTAEYAETRFILLLVFMTGGVYIRFIGAIIDKPKIDPKDFLPRDEYKSLYSVAEEAMAGAGVEGKIYVATDNSFDAGISKQGDTYLLFIGAIMLNSLSRDELFNVLLHEFAHYSKDYTPKSTYGFFNRFIEHETDGSTITDVIISIPMRKYGEEFVFYTLLASEYIESMADSVTIEKGDPKSFVSALAKCNFYESYGRITHKYQSAPLFESEEVTNNVATLNLNAFHNAVNENTAKWLSEYEKEIQPRNATHPIYRMRRDAVGVSADEVKISMTFSDDLEKERKATLEKLNDEICKQLSEHYSELRKVNYLDPLAIIEEWQSGKKEYSSAELIPVIDALVGIWRFEEAEELCDRIIAEEENVYATAYPRHIKGTMMLLRDDERGIDLLYEAIELNSNLLEASINQIGEFACRHGMQDELDKYREKATALTQKMIDEDEKANVLTQTDKVVADDMPEEALKAHIDYISSISENIKSIYVVKKVISDTFSSHVFLIEFEKESTQETINEAMNKIFRYLDTLDDEQYSLFLYNKFYKNIVKKVKGSLKYSKE